MAVAGGCLESQGQRQGQRPVPYLSRYQPLSCCAPRVRELTVPPLHTPLPSPPHLGRYQPLSCSAPRVNSLYTSFNGPYPGAMTSPYSSSMCWAGRQSRVAPSWIRPFAGLYSHQIQHGFTSEAHQIQPRCTPDARRIHTRFNPDALQMHARFNPDSTKIQPRSKPGSNQIHAS